MGTTASLPDEVIANSVAPYCFRKRNDFLSLRATCKLGADLARRDLTATAPLTCSASSKVVRISVPDGYVGTVMRICANTQGLTTRRSRPSSTSSKAAAHGSLTIPGTATATRSAFSSARPCRHHTYRVLSIVWGFSSPTEDQHT